MVQNSSRLAHLLGEMRRQMNGAVVGGMRFYGEEYGLNYGVSLVTVRTIARGEVEGYDISTNHRYAKLLYQQEVRELRLAALYLADSSKVCEELDFWAQGIINTEVAEEVAFALLARCEGIDVWLEGESEVLQYTALMAIAQREAIELARYQDRIIELLNSQTHIISNAVVVLLDSALRRGVDRGEIEAFMDALPECGATEFVRGEISWRLEFA